MKCFSLVILRLCNDFQLSTNPGTGKKVCGGGWWWVVVVGGGGGGGVLMRI